MTTTGHPNPNRATAGYCPYCSGESLFPSTESRYAWRCTECCRVFSITYHGSTPTGVAHS